MKTHRPSHKSKHLNGGTGQRVTRRTWSDMMHPVKGQQRMSLAESMVLRQKGYGSLDELEKRLAALTPKLT